MMVQFLFVDFHYYMYIKIVFLYWSQTCDVNIAFSFSSLKSHLRKSQLSLVILQLPQPAFSV